MSASTSPREKDRPFAGRERARASAGGCSRCGKPTEVELIIQARPKSRKGTFATRARRVCGPCGEQVFEAMERELDS